MTNKEAVKLLEETVTECTEAAEAAEKEPGKKDLVKWKRKAARGWEKLADYYRQRDPEGMVE